MEHIIILDKEHMLSVLNCSLELPYRFQRNVRIVIPYTEFSEFVRKSVRAKTNFLSMPLELYEKAVSRDDLMLRLFYLEISKTVITEINLASRRLKSCTEIVHSFPEDCLSVELNKMCNDVSQKALTLAIDEVKREVLTQSISKRSTVLLNYAIVIRALSKLKLPELINIKI